MFMFYEEQVCHYSSAAFLTHQKKKKLIYSFVDDRSSPYWNLVPAPPPPSLSLSHILFAILYFCLNLVLLMQV